MSLRRAIYASRTETRAASNCSYYDALPLFTLVVTANTVGQPTVNRIPPVQVPKIRVGVSMLTARNPLASTGMAIDNLLLLNLLTLNVEFHALAVIKRPLTERAGEN